MSGLDAELPDLDVSALNRRPAGHAGFIRNVDGHFADENGQRQRFLGTNLCFGGAFPEKSEAQPLAVRMSKLGINVVRLHHIDNAESPRGIWLSGQKGLDPNQLDRLDWLIAKLAEQGIYVNINLHVSRVYPDMDPELDRAFRYGKALDNFYPPYIKLQKDYARALLTHRNPYTGRSYVAEPAVLCVEINNENSLTTTNWEDLADLPHPWAGELRRRWNAWLRQRYTSMDQVRRAWQEVSEPLGSNMLSDVDLRKGFDAWKLEAPAPARAATRMVFDGPRPDMKSLQAELTRPGSQSWHFQLNHPGLTLRENQIYTFTFWAKSDPPRSIRTEARLAQEPWNHLGLNRSIALTPQWQQFTFPFLATDGRNGVCRVGWGFGNTLGRVWVAGMSLKPGGLLGTPNDQSLEAGNIGLTRTNDTTARQADYQQFLMETEQDYHGEMMRFLKNELGLRSLVTNTQASYGGLAGVLREASLSDFVDMHGYWQHPRFPGRPWDRKNWNIPNTSMVDEADGGVLGRIALHRVEGKPFTVSEYNHPTPNDHCAEMFPMLSAMGAFQDWDGLYQFTYSHSSDQWDQPKIDSYFDLVNHPGQLVWLPIAAKIFRSEAVAAGTRPVVLQLPAKDEATEARRTLSEVWASAGAPEGLPTTRRVAVRMGSGTSAVVPESIAALDGERVSSTGQITWRPPRDGDPNSRFLIDAPAVRCAIGFLQNETIGLQDVSFQLDRASGGWAALGLAALDDQPISRSQRMLLVAVGQVANTGMRWNEQRTSVSDQWGREPTIAEGIGATIRMPGTVNVRALNSRGEAAQKVSVETGQDGSRFDISSRYETLWYLVTRP